MEPKQSSGGSSGAFGGDMMAEMQRKLAARLVYGWFVLESR